MNDVDCVIIIKVAAAGALLDTTWDHKADCNRRNGMMRTMHINIRKRTAFILLLSSGFCFLAFMPRVAPVKPGLDSYGDPLPPGAVARLGTVRFRHGQSVSCIAFTPDGKKLAFCGVGDLDNAVRMVETSTGNELKTFDLQPGEEPWGLALSPDGNILTVNAFQYAKPRGTFKESGVVTVVWDTATAKELARYRGDKHPSSAGVFSPNGKVFIAQEHERISQHSNNYRTTMKAWDAPAGKLLHAFEDLEGKMSHPVFSPDGKRLAISISSHENPHEPTKGFFCDTENWGVVQPMAARPVYVTSWTGRRHDKEVLAYSPDGKMLIGGDSFHRIDFMKAETGELIERVDLPRSTQLVTSLSFSRDGKWMAVVSDRHVVSIWDLAARKKLYDLGTCASVAVFSPTEPLLVTGRGNYEMVSGYLEPALRFWDPYTGNEIQKHDAPAVAVQLTQWLPDGNLVAVSHNETCYRLWASHTGKLVAKVSTDARYSLAWSAASPDGKLLAVSQYKDQRNDETIQIFDLATNKVIHRLDSERVRLPLGFTVDGRFLLLGTEPNTIDIWDTSLGKISRSLDLKKELGKGFASHAAISRDGKKLALQVSEQLVEPDPNDIDPGGREWPHGYYQCMIDMTTGMKMWNTDRDDSVLKGGYPQVASSFIFSPDGKILSERVGQKIRLRDSANGAILRTLDCEITAHPWAKLAEAMAFSPDSKKLIATDLRNTIYVWDVATGKELRKFTCHRGIIYSISVSLDGRRFATSSEDSTVLIWQLDGG